jgi:hypothetical protein
VSHQEAYRVERLLVVGRRVRAGAELPHRGGSAAPQRSIAAPAARRMCLESIFGPSSAGGCLVRATFDSSMNTRLPAAGSACHRCGSRRPARPAVRRASARPPRPANPRVRTRSRRLKPHDSGATDEQRAAAEAEADDDRGEAPVSSPSWSLRRRRKATASRPRRPFQARRSRARPPQDRCEGGAQDEAREVTEGGERDKRHLRVRERPARVRQSAADQYTRGDRHERESDTRDEATSARARGLPLRVESWPCREVRSPEAPRLARAARRWVAGLGRTCLQGQ